MKGKKVVVLDVVGLSPKHFARKDDIPNLSSLAVTGTLRSINPVFPAVTLPAQASMTTGLYPSAHGIIANGRWERDFMEVSFWDQANTLVNGHKIWEKVKEKRPELTTALIFMQNSLFANSDIVITPKPFHSDDGLIQWCYSKPVGFYESLCDKVGAFNLMHYWGPMASIESSRWISGAAIETIKRGMPDLMFVYLPHLDYCLQKLGPFDQGLGEELRAVDSLVGNVVNAVKDQGELDDTLFVVTSEYAVQQVDGDLAINRILRKEGLLSVREIQGREYLDFELSPAFAMVDHQVAHIFIKDGFYKRVRSLLENTPGIDFILNKDEQKPFHVQHENSGDLVAVSSRNRWFSYYWWEDSSKEPDFAGHVDIHRKPGYDPLELFLEPGTMNISQDTSLIKGSHGYPALVQEDQIPLLISGELADLEFDLPEVIDSTVIPQIISTILA